MKYQYNDGGRALAGYKGRAGDCVCRAIAIVSGKPYSEVYKALAGGAGSERKSNGKSARNGIRVQRKWFKEYMAELGFEWTPTMFVGHGCKVHLRADELPQGKLVVAVSRHYTAVIDGVIHDTHNPSERSSTIYPLGCLSNIPKGAKLLANGNGYEYAPDRCVYGYWTLKAN